MCGAASSVGSRYRTGRKAVLGKKICQDGDLQQMLKDWEALGVWFTGAILLAEGKDSVTAYDMERDKWTVDDSVLGTAGVILKTTADGWLYLRLTANGFHWEHASGSYRRLTQGDASGSRLQVVDSSTQKFAARDVQRLLEEQRSLEYADGTPHEFAAFAKRVFNGVSGKSCEGVKPYDALQGKKPGT